MNLGCVKNPPPLATKKPREPPRTVDCKGHDHRDGFEYHCGAKMDDEITGMYELLDALEATLIAADPDKREKLAKTIDAYSEDFPEDFFWAVGPQSPTLLHNLMMTIDVGARPDTPIKAARRH